MTTCDQGSLARPTVFARTDQNTNFINGLCAASGCYLEAQGFD